MNENYLISNTKYKIILKSYKLVNSTEVCYKFFNFHKEALILSFRYLKRIGKYNNFIMTYLACNIIATKYLDDYLITNSSLSIYWKIPIETINYYEAKVFSLLNYNLE